MFNLALYLCTSPVFNLCLRIPPGFTVADIPKEHTHEYALKVHQNIYGQVQAGRVWYNYLSEKLNLIGFKQCARDECIFTRGQLIYILYTDDSIIVGTDNEQLQQCAQELREANLQLTVEGDISDFLGVSL